MRGALSPDAFHNVLQALEVADGDALAIACSGGVDSMALAHLAHGWAQTHRATVTALVVDHGIRAESATEAALTCERLQRMGMRAVLLRWEGEKPSANLSEAAREARYRLLTDWCRTQRIAYLLTAHHRDDQAETFLLRLARGSGVDGLSGIPFRRVDGGITLLRPLLPWPKAALQAYAAAHGLEWVDDASNHTPRYSRNRMRRVMATLAEEGVDSARIAQAAFSLARAREALEWLGQNAWQACVIWHPQGCGKLDVARWRTYPEETRLSVLSALLCAVSGHARKPRLRHLKPLHDGLFHEPDIKPATLWGARIDRKGWCLRDAGAVMREPLPLQPATPLVWDGRFRVTLSHSTPIPVTVAALGRAGWAQIPEPHRRTLKGVPHAAWLATPALWEGETLLAAPLAGWQAAHVEARCELRSQFTPPFMPQAAQPHSLWRLLWPTGQG